MSKTSPSTTIVPTRADEGMLDRLALVGFLAGYSGPTRDSYRTDLRLFTVWLIARQVRLLEVQRTHIELYGRWLEEQGRALSTVGRRLSTLAGFYRYCEQEQILERSPAAHVRRPKQNYESRTLGLDRSELGRFLVAAGLSSDRDHALASLLALNGLRISEALGADIEISGSNAVIARCGSCARVASRSRSRSPRGPLGHSIWRLGSESMARSCSAPMVNVSTDTRRPGS